MIASSDDPLGHAPALLGCLDNAARDELAANFCHGLPGDEGGLAHALVRLEVHECRITSVPQVTLHHVRSD